MTNQTAIIDYINKFVLLTDEEAGIFSSNFKEVKIKKRQLIVQPNFITKTKYFILKGAILIFTTSASNPQKQKEIEKLGGPV